MKKRTKELKKKKIWKKGIQERKGRMDDGINVWMKKVFNNWKMKEKTGNYNDNIQDEKEVSSWCNG